MHLAGLDLLFWAAGLTGHIVLLVVLFGRRRAAQFPAFTALIAADVVRTIVLYFTLHYGTKHAYFVTYWSLAIVDVALQLAVVYEMASHVFRPLGEWAPDVRRGFLWLVSGSIAIAAALTWLAAPAARFWIQVVVIRGNFFASALMSELFIGMVVLSVTVGLPWKTHVARIAQGLGAYSIFSIVTDAAHSYFGVAHGVQAYERLSHIRMTIYLVCVAYWIVMLWRSAPQPRQLPAGVRRQLSDLQAQTASELYKIRSWRRE